MKNFDFYLPIHVLFGAGQLNNIHSHNMPGTKALIVTSEGQSTKKFGYLERVEHELDLAGRAHALYDKVKSNPTTENVMDGAEFAKSSHCDFIVALGGGSVMDCGKCIALMAANSGYIWDYSYSKCGGKQQAANNALPIIAITTSAGTGSEVDNSAVISNIAVKEKSSIHFPSMFPTLSIVDAELMKSVPPNFTAYQGMDAFFHASESMINRNENPIGEMFALKAIELINKFLPIAYRDGGDLNARENVALANTLAGYYMLCTSGHVIEHIMGSYHDDLVHGAGLIMTSHAYYNFFAQKGAAEEPMIKMAKAMGISEATSSKDFIKALDGLIASIGCGDLKMSDAGITADELKLYPRRIHDVLGGDITADPVMLSEADYLSIYEESYR